MERAFFFFTIILRINGNGLVVLDHDKKKVDGQGHLENPENI